MSVQLGDFISSYKLPGGRAVHAGRKIVEGAKQVANDALVARSEAFLAAADATHDLEIRYRLAQATPQYSAGATDADAAVDRALGALHRANAAFLELADNPSVDAESLAAASFLSREIFPRGLAHVTSMSFPEEYETVAKLLKRLQGKGDLAILVKRVALQPYVAALAAANEVYGEELAKTPELEGPTWAEIRAAQAVQYARQLELIAAALGAFPDSDEASTAQRTTLLEPLVTQQRALAALYKRRRGAQDVNPDTGELVTPDAAAGQSPSDGAVQPSE